MTEKCLSLRSSRLLPHFSFLFQGKVRTGRKNGLVCLGIAAECRLNQGGPIVPSHLTRWEELSPYPPQRTRVGLVPDNAQMAARPAQHTPPSGKPAQRQAGLGRRD